TGQDQVGAVMLRPASSATMPPTLDVAGPTAFPHLPAVAIRQYAREGRLPAFKADRQWLFFRDELEPTRPLGGPSPRRTLGTAAGRRRVGARSARTSSSSTGPR